MAHRRRIVEEREENLRSTEDIGLFLQMWLNQDDAGFRVLRLLRYVQFHNSKILHPGQEKL